MFWNRRKFSLRVFERILLKRSSILPENQGEWWPNLCNFFFRFSKLPRYWFSLYLIHEFLSLRNIYVYINSFSCNINHFKDIVLSHFPKRTFFVSQQKMYNDKNTTQSWLSVLPYNVFVVVFDLLLAYSHFCSVSCKICKCRNCTKCPDTALSNVYFLLERILSCLWRHGCKSITQNDVWLSVFVLQYFKNKACHQKRNAYYRYFKGCIGKPKKYIAIPFKQKFSNARFSLDLQG